jgi:metal-dependent HD superfamily phosphatase/phosphodiesterase
VVGLGTLTEKFLPEVEVSPSLLETHLRESRFLSRAYSTISKDPEFNALVEMSNIMAVKRLRYNDHGPVHAKIVAGASLEIFKRILRTGVKPTTIRDGVAENIDDAMLVVMLGALLHDIGNSIHRVEHERTGSLLAVGLLDRVLRKIYPKNKKKRIMLRQEILHTIFSTSFEVQSLTIEAGCVKVGDGVDMSKGRARFPYKMGKNDIHAISAFSIDKVGISSDPSAPVLINVYMTERAGVFQLEKILIPKINSSGLRDYIRLRALYNGKELSIEY